MRVDLEGLGNILLFRIVWGTQAGVSRAQSSKAWVSSLGLWAHDCELESSGLGSSWLTPQGSNPDLSLGRTFSWFGDRYVAQGISLPFSCLEDC